MEPFQYDDYSEFDTNEVDFEFPVKTILKPFRRPVSPFEVDVDEDAIEKIRCKARQATIEFLNDCDSARQRAKKKDEDALKSIDDAIQNCSPSRPPLPRRRRSTGVPPRPVLEEINTLEAFGKDTRPLHEKIQKPLVLRSKSNRSSTPVLSSNSRDKLSASYRKHAGSLPPKGTYKLEKETKPSVHETPDMSEKHIKVNARRKRRDIETKLDGILDYEVPASNDFKSMRSALRDINDKMATHRLLIDRYSGLQIKDKEIPIQERIETKYDELVSRVPSLSGVQRKYGPRSDEIISEFDPRLIAGYSTGLSITQNDNSRELRGRIRNLLCRTRETSKKDAKNPHLMKPFDAQRHELRVE